MRNLVVQVRKLRMLQCSNYTSLDAESVRERFDPGVTLGLHVGQPAAFLSGLSSCSRLFECSEQAQQFSSKLNDVSTAIQEKA